MPPQRFDQALDSEFLASIVERFGDAVGVEHQRVSGEEAAFAYRAIPFFKDSEYRARGFQPFQSVIAPEEKSGEMPAIRISQAARRVVIFRKEERGISAVDRIRIKELVHGAQEALRFVQSDGALAAQVRLQISH